MLFRLLMSTGCINWKLHISRRIKKTECSANGLGDPNQDGEACQNKEELLGKKRGFTLIIFTDSHVALH